MLLEIQEDKVITVDKKPVMKNLRCNITPSKQMRLKGILIHGDIERELDIEVQRISKLQIKMNSISVTIGGVERIMDISYNLVISYELHKLQWNVSGTVGRKRINETIKSCNWETILPKLLECIVF